MYGKVELYSVTKNRMRVTQVESDATEIVKQVNCFLFGETYYNLKTYI